MYLGLGTFASIGKFDAATKNNEAVWRKLRGSCRVMEVHLREPAFPEGTVSHDRQIFDRGAVETCTSNPRVRDLAGF